MSSTNSNFIIIKSSFATKNEAKSLSHKIIEANLGACVQIHGPVTSIYKWNDKLVNDDEYIISIKTIESKYEQIEQLIFENHTYENPEIIVSPITNGSDNFLEWIQLSVKQ